MIVPDSDQRGRAPRLSHLSETIYVTDGAVACLNPGRLHPPALPLQKGFTVAVLKPRNRLVYFRVTEEEFEKYSSLCQLKGARSLSDLARGAVDRLLVERDHSPIQVELADRIVALNALTVTLNDKVQMLIQMLQGEQRRVNGAAQAEKENADV